MVKTVFFDVGETLVDETRLWGAWADWLGVSRLTLFGVLGAVIERGEDHRRTFEILRPGIDLEAEDAARRAAGVEWKIELRDLYSGAIPCLTALRQDGYRVGVAGNMPEEAEASVRALDLPIDLLGSSASVGFEKPDPKFFARLVELAGTDPAQIAYVGDRVDNDVVPASDAGMAAIFLRRGPWAAIQRTHPGAERAASAIDSLAELPDVLRRI